MTTATMTAEQTKDLANNALNALTLAQEAVNQAKALLEAGGVSSGAGGDLNATLQTAINAASPGKVHVQGQATATPAKRSTTSSGGRAPSAEQMAVRASITEWAASGDAGLFTVNTMTKALGKDKIQTRNAINALTEQGLLVRWAEKFQTAPGAREIIYKPTAYDVGI
ncbi:hypothetical protein D3C76_165760 [compost metagenome]